MGRRNLGWVGVGDLGGNTVGGADDGEGGEDTVGGADDWDGGGVEGGSGGVVLEGGEGFPGGLGVGLGVVLGRWGRG